MKRRTFIASGCSVCLGAVGLTALVPACSATRYIPGKISNDGLLIDTEDFKIKQNEKTTYRSYIIVRNEELNFPICVYRFSDKDYSALWMECAHQGAEVQVSGTHLQCPAHGSEYDNRGNVTNGPAETGLRTFPVSLSNNQLFIDLRKK